ncbi:MAG TPA: hypothetical protein VGL66_10440 [Caulobacteraceae bacterium]
MARTREHRRGLAPSTPLTEPEIRRATEGLGAELKAMFNNIAAEPLPHEIVDLVAALDGRTQRRRQRSH